MDEKKDNDRGRRRYNKIEKRKREKERLRWRRGGRDRETEKDTYGEEDIEEDGEMLRERERLLYNR